MKIQEHDIAPIKALGYSEEEARFLEIVVTHSGYFVLRQFSDFVGAKSGKRSSNLGHKIESRGHGCWRTYPGSTDRVYHLFSQTLYNRIGKNKLGYQRAHGVEFIKERLILLDFIIANRQHDYLETEQQKVDYFGRLGLPQESLPVKRYPIPLGSGPILKYFVDKYPLFLDSSDSTSSPVLTFSFVDPGHSSVKAFQTHLDGYRELLYQLNEWRLLYLSNSTANFAKAQACFSRRFRSVLSNDIPGEILNYFRLRKAWDLQNYRLFSNRKIEELNAAAKRFQGDRFEALYSAWSSNRVGTEVIAREFGQTEPDRKVGFTPYLVRGNGLGASPFEEAGDKTCKEEIRS